MPNLGRTGGILQITVIFICPLPPLLLVFDGLGIFHHKHCRYENDHAADGKDDLAGDGEHQGIEPRCVEHIQKRDIAYYKADHHPILLFHLSEHGLQLVVDDSHVGQLGHDGQERILQRSVILTGDQGVAPFLVDAVADLFLQISQCGFKVGGDHHCIADKGLKDPLHGRLKVDDILLNRTEDVIGTDIRGGNDRQRRRLIQYGVPQNKLNRFLKGDDSE